MLKERSRVELSTCNVMKTRNGSHIYNFTFYSSHIKECKGEMNFNHLLSLTQYTIKNVSDHFNNVIDIKITEIVCLFFFLVFKI